MTRPTIKDVSRLAGVSIGTVSNVVNGRANITPHTRDKVHRAIEQLGYRVNRAARSLPAGRTGLIGYRMPDARTLNSSMDLFLHQVVASAGDVGMEVLLFTPRSGQSELDAYREVIHRGGVDAFVLSGIEYEDPRVEFLNRSNVHYAAFGRAQSSESSVWIDVDGADGLEQAVTHLHDVGLTRIGFLGWPEGSLTGDERYSGYRHGMERAGLDLNPSWVVRTNDGFQEGKRAAQVFRDAGCEGVVCVSDTFALGLMSGARSIGLTPGIDLAVTGFDNVSAAELVEPGLTSVRQPMEKVGHQLVERLALLSKGTGQGYGGLLKPDLVIRGSSAPNAR